MRSHGTVVPIVLVLVASVRTVSAQAPGNSSDETAIRAVMEATTKAFSSHDAKAWAQFCTETARLVTVRGESMDGVAEIEKGLAIVFATRAGAVTLRTLDMSIRFIRPDVALAYLTNELSGLVGPDGQTQPPHRELSIRVVVRNDGQWKIAAFHNTILQ